MALAAVDCRPLRDTNTGTTALATLRITDNTINSPTAAAAATASGLRTPGSARKVAYNGQLYGAEAVGRKCTVKHSRNGGKGWDKAQITEYNAGTGQHKLRFSSSKAEEWLHLADLKFKWSQVLPPTAPANPTHKPEFSKEAAVNRRLRVYWPAMQKWYQGTVKSYDPKTDKHTVLYKDGDTQTLMLKHEPVVWCDDEFPCNGTSSSGEQQPQQPPQQQQLQQPTASTPRHSSSAANTPRAAATPRGAAAAAERGFGAAAGAAAPANAKAAAVPAQPPLRSMSPRATAAAAAAAIAATFPGTVSARFPNADGGRAGGALTKAALAARAAAAKAGAAGLAGKAAAGQAARAAGAAAGRPGGSKGAAGANGLPPGTNHLSIKTAVGAAAGRQQQQLAGQQRAGSALGKHGRDAGSQGDSAAKRMRRGGQPRGLPAAAGVGSKGAASAIADKHLAVGCRVGVYWRLDKVFYRGKLTSYSPQSGKFTIKYDDGQSEALLLEKERFVWHNPRGGSAGYRPALHTLMQQLGADSVQPMPRFGEDGVIVPETPAPESAPHPPMSGAGAVGWRIKLYWGADQGWHEAEVLSHDEVRRKHHLLYLDGEEEWVDLSKEAVVFIKATRHGAISAGQINSDEVPKGRDAVGWHIAVYWKDDRTFYSGELVDYEASTGRHKVLYSDGEEEWLLLRNERVIWRLPPSEDSDDEDDDDDDDLLLSDDDALGSDDEAGRSSGRGRFNGRGRKRRLHLNSDSGSASSGHIKGSGYGTPGFGDDLLHDDLAGDGTAGSAFASAGRMLGAGIGGSAAAGGDGLAGHQHHHTLHLSLKRGPGGVVSSSIKGRGVGPPPAAGGILKPVGLLRQGSLGLAGAGMLRGLGSGSGHLNLPPLQLGKRTSGSGEGLGSPIEGAQAAEQLQLHVRIVPGGAVASAAKPPAVPGSSNGAAEAAGTAALQPILQKLPARQQRTAARLQRKMDRLHMILGKLASTAGTMGWKLDPQQLPSLLTATENVNGNSKAGGRQPMSPRSPMSPRARAGNKAAAGSGAVGIKAAAAGPTSPRLNNTFKAAAAGQAATVGIGPVAAAAGVAGAASPTSAGRTVAVHKTCAVKTRPGQGAPGSAQRLKMRPLADLMAQPSTPTAAATAAAPAGNGVEVPAAAGSAVGVVASSGVGGPAAAAAADMNGLPVLPHVQVKQQQRQGKEPAHAAGVAAPAAAAAGSPAAAHGAQQQQQSVGGTSVAQAQGPPAAAAPAPVAASAAAAGPADKPSSRAVPRGAAKSPPAASSVPQAAAPACPRVLNLAGLVPAAAVAPVVSAVPPAAAPAAARALSASAAGFPSQLVAAGGSPTQLAAAAAAAGSPAQLAAVKRAPAPPPSLPDVSNPSAPSVAMTADDVVLKLQAMAQLQQQVAAAQAAAAAGGSPTTAQPAAAAGAAAANADAAAAAGAGVQPMETD